MKVYTSTVFENLGDVLRFCRDVIKERKTDVSDFNNLKNIFLSGRLSAKIPTASNDISSDDRVNDITITPMFLYVVVDNAGTAVWRRVALSTF